MFHFLTDCQVSSCVASEGLSNTRLDFLPCMQQTAQTETDNTEDSRRGDGTVLTLIETMRTALRLTFHLTATLQLEPRPWQRLMRRQRDVDVTSRRNVSVDALFHLRITPFARCQSVAMRTSYGPATPRHRSRLAILE